MPVRYCLGALLLGCASFPAAAQDAQSLVALFLVVWCGAAAFFFFLFFFFFLWLFCGGVFFAARS